MKKDRKNIILESLASMLEERNMSKVTTALPFEDDFCLIHKKNIEKQVQQNKFYNEEISGYGK